jgi:hypothetical protein
MVAEKIKMIEVRMIGVRMNDARRMMLLHAVPFLRLSFRPIPAAEDSLLIALLESLLSRRGVEQAFRPAVRADRMPALAAEVALDHSLQR